MPSPAAIALIPAPPPTAQSALATALKAEIQSALDKGLFDYGRALEVSRVAEAVADFLRARSNTASDFQATPQPTGLSPYGGESSSPNLETQTGSATRPPTSPPASASRTPSVMAAMDWRRRGFSPRWAHSLPGIGPERLVRHEVSGLRMKRWMCLASTWT